MAVPVQCFSRILSLFYTYNKHINTYTGVYQPKIKPFLHLYLYNKQINTYTHVYQHIHTFVSETTKQNKTSPEISPVGFLRSAAASCMLIHVYVRYKKTIKILMVLMFLFNFYWHLYSIVCSIPKYEKKNILKIFPVCRSSSRHNVMHWDIFYNEMLQNVTQFLFRDNWWVDMLPPGCLNLVYIY